MKRLLLKSCGFALGLVVGCDPGQTDYGVWETGFADFDADGFDADEDCDDEDADVHPGAEEICDDGVDNDCDNATDDEDTDCPA